METLLLDQSYRPLVRISWERAITLLYEDKIDVVAEYDKYVRSPSTTIKVPAVVRFKKRHQDKKRQVKFSRENIWLRDHGKCQYCGNRVERSEFTYDHVLPRAQGGRTTWENIVVACVPCNQKKGGRRPEQAKMQLLSKPVKPKELPQVLARSLTWNEKMPGEWREFLESIKYWSTKLEK